VEECFNPSSGNSLSVHQILDTLRYSINFWTIFHSKHGHIPCHIVRDVPVPARDAPDIRPDNPAFFDIRYTAGYQIALPDIRPDIRQMCS
jgi:hypothetical protein